MPILWWNWRGKEIINDSDDELLQNSLEINT